MSKKPNNKRRGSKPRRTLKRAGDKASAAQQRRSRDSRRRWVMLTLFVVLLIALAAARIFSPVGERLFGGLLPPPPANERIEVILERIEILDGDTIRLDGHTIRFLGCDTPEGPTSFFRGDQEPWARRATAYVQRKLREAERIEVEVIANPDRFGRLLGHVFVDGEPLSLLLVEARLATETISLYGDNGFPDIAERILEAAPPVEELPFQDPREWRRENRIRN